MVVANESIYLPNIFNITMITHSSIQWINLYTLKPTILLRTYISNFISFKNE
jgi:hypothetical protein